MRLFDDAKFFLALALMLLVTICGGCSDLTAEPATAKMIDIDVAVMNSPAEVLPPAVSLTRNAERFAFYADTATRNFGEYLFTGKTIYCTPAVYHSLQSKKNQSANYARYLDATTQPSGQNMAAWLKQEAQWIKNIKAQKDGKTHD